ncbi:hypothetical protein D9M71_480670 [compost metagenome]
MVEGPGLFQLRLLHREPAALMEVLQVTPQQPVHQGAQHVAAGRHRHQRPGRIGLGQQQPDQQCFRLQGQQGGGAECGEEQAQVAGECQHACVSEMRGASVASGWGGNKPAWSR